MYGSRVERSGLSHNEYHARPMIVDALQSRLTESPDHEAWVTAVAACFRAAGLHFGHGTDNAEDEAYWLIRHVQQWRDDLWNAPPDAERIGAVVALVRRRIHTRAPLAYLLGEAWFAGLPFFVDENVLVPRSPLAEVIERGFDPWVRLADRDRVLDVGTGSGCLAIAAAVHCPAIVVDATDVSDAALTVARRNIERHGVGGRVFLHAADLMPDNGLTYRVIMSNPPYVPSDVLRSLPEEYAHEPPLALDGGPSGLEPTERLLRAAAPRLARDGVLIVEVGSEADALMNRHPRLPALWLDFERGGEGVFVVTAGELEEFLRSSGTLRGSDD
jgi:ribosomal protein L3 glutamine methyltransferase